MQNQRGFVGLGILIAILVGVVVLGGGAYYVVNQQSTSQTTSENFDNLQQLPTTNTQVQQKQTTTGNTSSQTTPTQNTATVASKITITAPASGATLQADQQTIVRWTVPGSVLNSFPSDFDVYVFLYVQKQGDAEEVNSASIADGNKASAGSATWNIPAYITSGTLKSGTYKIVAQLQATPKDQSRLCDPIASQGKHECVPSAADSAVMQRSVAVKGETGWFTIAPSATVKDNNPPVIASLTGPTSLRIGEKGTWLLTATDDLATSLKYSCYVGLYKEMQASEHYGGGTSMASTEGTALPTKNASVNTAVAFEFMPTKTTSGKEYYDISCNVIEPLPNNGELDARYQKSVQFSVSP